MTPPFDTRQIRRSFGRAAASYEAHAVLQREVERRLLERLEYAKTPPHRALDLGCGPGNAARALRARWKNAQVLALDAAMPMLRRIKPGWLRPLARINADARALPLADASIDLLYSNLCIQWIDDLPALFDEFRRVLRPDGYLALSTFGPDTLHELRSAWAQVDAASARIGAEKTGDARIGPARVNAFADIARVGDALLHAGFRDPVLDAERFTLTYDDAPTLMRDLKAIGATNANARRTRGLTGRETLRRVAAAYEGFRANGVLPATYEVIYAHAFAPAPGRPRRQGADEIVGFPVERLRGSRR